MKSFRNPVILACVLLGFARAFAADPEVLWSIRGAGEAGVVEAVVPLFITVRLEPPEGKEGALVLAPAEGSWSDAISVELVAASAKETVRARQVGATWPAASSATLDAEQGAEAVWMFSSTELARLPAGEHRVRVALAIERGTGWKGRVTAEPRAIRMMGTRSNLTPAELDAQARLLAEEAMVLADFPKAARLLDARLSGNPDNIDLLKARAILCLHAGNLSAANTCVNRALDQVEREGWRHPPAELHALAQGIVQAMLADSGREDVPPTTPDWSVPPAQVREPRYPPKAPKPAGAAATAPTSGLPSSQIRVAVPSSHTSASPDAVSPKPAAPAVNAPAVTGPAPIAALVPKPGAPSPGVLVTVAELSEDKILADASGQWAAGAVASSQYSKTHYTAAEATGAPDVPRASDHPRAWCHGGGSQKTDWLELAFATPVRATEVRVRQTLNPGTIVKVEAIEADGTSHLWWEGKDPGRTASAGTIAWFAVRVPKTDYPVARIKLTLEIAARVGWKQIDAVQLVGE